eukprot:SAG22_NODE_799_length_7128_cov_14.224356_2_plen_235_part_00
MLSDMELDDPGSLENVTLLRNRFVNNAGCGLELSLHALSPTRGSVTVRVEQSHIAGNNGYAGILVQRHVAGLPDGFMRFKDNYIQSDATAAIWIEKPTAPNCPMEMRNTTIDASGASGSTAPILFSNPAPWPGHPAPHAAGGVSMLGLAVIRRDTVATGSAIQPYIELLHVKNVSIRDVVVSGADGAHKRPGWAVCRAELGARCSCGGTADQGGPDCCAQPNYSVSVQRAQCVS